MANNIIFNGRTGAQIESAINAEIQALDTRIDNLSTPPTLAPVATSGAYSDLTGRPTLGTAATANTGDFATAAQGLLANTAVQPATLTTALAGKVNTVVGKGLSTEDYTTAEKTKLSGIATGATANSTDAQLRDRATHTGTQTASTISDFNTSVDARITTQKGVANGVAPLGSDSKISATYLPSYVDDVLEFVNLVSFPVTGETGKIYISLDTNTSYRWSGSTYVEIASGGAVQSVAGKTGNVILTSADVGLDLVVNADTTTTANITDSSGKRFVSDSERTAISHSNRAILDATTAAYTTAEQTKLAGLANVATSGAYADLTGRPTLGTASAQDSSDFATSAQGALASTAIQPTALNTALLNKVDVVAGKGLSTNDYTTAEQTKLLGIEAGATANSTDAQLRDRATHTGTQTSSTISDFNTATDARIDLKRGVADGIAPLDSNIKISATYLPSYVDSVLEFANLATLPVTGSASTIYVTLDTNKTYRWSGSTYVEISSSDVNSVAGKTGFVVLNAADVGLGDVNNTSDLNKPISTATQTALDDKYDASNPDNYITSAQAPVQSVAGRTGSVTLTKSDVGLGNVLNVDTTTTTNIVDSANKRFVTDAEKTDITHSNRVILDATTAAYTTEEQTKLASLSTVATTGAYSDLTGRPTLGTASTANTGDFATAAQGALADTAIQPAALSSALSTKVNVIVGKGLSTEDYTTVEKNKLASIETGATANSTDAQLRDRATHTGEQGINTVTGLQTALSSLETDIDAVVTTLRGGVSIDGDTLDKLNDKIVVLENKVASNNSDIDTLQEAADAIIHLQSELSAVIDADVTGVTVDGNDLILSRTHGDLVVDLSDFRDRSTHTGTQPANTISDFDTASDARITAQKGVADGIAPLNASTKVERSFLPEFVQRYTNRAAFPVTGELNTIYIDWSNGELWSWNESISDYDQLAVQTVTSSVIEVGDLNALPATGIANTIYITIDTDKLYRWNGTGYTEIVGGSATGSTEYNQTSAYTVGDKVLYRGITVTPNDTIPANTAFSWGTTGATWSPAEGMTGFTWQGVFNPTLSYNTLDIVARTATATGLFFARAAASPGNITSFPWSPLTYFEARMGIATETTGGREGWPPASEAGQQDFALHADSTWKPVDKTRSRITQTAHGFVVDHWIAHNGTSYVLADNDSVSTMDVVGVVTSVPTANTFVLQTQGYYTRSTGTHGLGANFISNTAGAITDIEPTGSSRIRKPVLIADSSTTGTIQIQIGTPVNGQTAVTNSGQNNAIVTGQTTTSQSFVDVAGGDFILPVAGTYSVTYNMSVQQTATDLVYFRLVNNAGVEVPGSMGYAQAPVNNGRFNISANVLVNTTGQEAYRLQWRVNFATGVIRNLSGSTTENSNSTITWQQIGASPVPMSLAGEFGEVRLPSTVTITGGNTTPSTAIDVMSFTLPSAGVWKVIYIAAVSTNGGGSNPTVGIFDSANTFITNSNTLGGFINTSNTLVTTSTGVTFITTSGSAVYKMRAWSGNGTGSINGPTGSNLDMTKVVYEKVSGFLPTVGQSVDFVQFRLAANTSAYTSNNLDIPLGTTVSATAGNIPVSPAGLITLTAGKTYRLTAQIALGNAGSNGYMYYGLFDANNVRIPNSPRSVAASTELTLSGISSAPTFEFVYTPTTNQVVKFRVDGVLGSPVILGDNSNL